MQRASPTWQNLIRSHRSSVALTIALLAPALAGAIGLGVEVSNWSVEQARMQRAADAAAISGAVAYQQAGNLQSAATAAARMAEVNGVSGSTSPVWNAASQTLTDNDIVVQVVNGLKKSSDTALQVNVKENVPLQLARLISSRGSVNVRATSTAELLQTANAGGGPQPCLVALQDAAHGGTGITASGYINVQAPDCSLRSNSTVSFAGGGTFNTDGIYAAGDVSIPSWVSVGGGKYPNSGAIADPYAADTALQTALAAAATASGPDIVCQNQNCGLPASKGSTFHGSYCAGQGTGTVNCYLQPGDYGQWAALGGGPYTFFMAPGLYVFNGVINLTNYTITNSTGVTILTTGTVNGSNTFNFNVTAPTADQARVTGGIAGIALAGTTTGKITLSGNPQFMVDGVVYFPNALFDDSNSPQLGNNNTRCLEIIAANITLSGNISIHSDCSEVSAQPFGSLPGTTTYKAALVQ